MSFEVPEDGHVANLADLVVDWDALREINPDIVAWVYMPGTVINYPVAHKDGDSEYVPAPQLQPGARALSAPSSAPSCCRARTPATSPTR